MSQLIEWHGIRSLFHDSQFLVFSGSGTVSVAERFLLELLGVFHPPGPRADQQAEDLKQIGRVLLAETPPWLQRPVPMLHSMRSFYRYEARDDLPSSFREPDALFGSFAIAATELESEMSGPDGTHGELWRVLTKSRTGLLRRLRFILLARFKTIPNHKLQAELDACCFTDPQLDLIRKWMRKEVDLVRQMPKPLVDRASGS